MNTIPPDAPDGMPYLPPEPPQWPKVIGILSIVWASLGLVCAPCGLIGPFIWPMVMPPEMTKDGLPPHMSVDPLLMGIQASGLLMAVLLLSAGVATLRRTAAGRTLHLVYGVLQLLSMAPGIWITHRLHVATQQWFADHPDSLFTKQQGGGGDAGFIIQVALMIVLGAMYPAFILVWFGLVKRTQQSMLEPAPEAQTA
jgi:hypothetical protein